MYSFDALLMIIKVISMMSCKKGGFFEFRIDEQKAEEEIRGEVYSEEEYAFEPVAVTLTEAAKKSKVAEMESTSTESVKGDELAPSFSMLLAKARRGHPLNCIPTFLRETKRWSCRMNRTRTRSA